MPNPQIQQALQRLNYNCQPPEVRRPLSMADYAEAHAALQVIEKAVARLGELEAEIVALKKDAAPVTGPCVAANTSAARLDATRSKQAGE